MVRRRRLSGIYRNPNPDATHSIRVLHCGVLSKARLCALLLPLHCEQEKRIRDGGYPEHDTESLLMM
jgi:hypothetical protein